MLVHCEQEILELAASCTAAPHAPVPAGWTADIWRMGDAEVEIAVRAYSALLRAGSSVDSEISELLGTHGIDLDSLLVDSGAGEDAEGITRADLCELVLASSLIAVDGAHSKRMFMPNVPKMSRRKSDSGVDIFENRLDQEVLGDLSQLEQLWLTSVKHSILLKVSDLRYKLQSSLSRRELGNVYLATQLRVLNGRLQEQGWSPESAERVFLFLRDFPHSPNVRLVAGAVIDSDAEDDLLDQLRLLPELTGRTAHFRIVVLPGLATVHERCP